MEQLIKYKPYLIIIGLLVLVKFVWVPQWQQKQQAWQVQHKHQSNLNKTKALLARKDEIQTSYDSMKVQLQQLEQQFAPTAALTSYKLAKQSRLEGLFSANNISLTNLSWREGVLVDDIQTLFLDTNFSSSLKDYLSLLAELQDNDELGNFSVDANQLTIRGQSATSLGSVTGRLTLKLAIKLMPEEQ